MTKLRVFISCVVFAVFTFAGLGCDNTDSSNNPIGKTYRYTFKDGQTISVTFLDNKGKGDGVANIASSNGIKGQCSYFYLDGDAYLWFDNNKLFDYAFWDTNKDGDISEFLYLDLKTKKLYEGDANMNSEVKGIQLQ